MRLYATLLALCATLVTGALPWQRCISTEGSGPQGVVLPGMHVHEGRQDRLSVCDRSPEPGHEGHEDHEGDHGGGCCVHTPTDSAQPASATAVAVPPIYATAAVQFVRPARAPNEIATPAANPPVPRRSTDTVALLL